MTDGMLVLVWLAVLAGGLGVTVAVRRLGASASHARDLLHVGAGVWALGWPWWNGTTAPLALVTVAAVVVALVPALASRWAPLDRFRRAVTGDDEGFGGLVVYTASFAALTWVGLLADPFPAAAGLLALALGDGVGGLVGRRMGRRFYTAPGAKRKSFEGSLAVAVFAAAGVGLAGTWYGAGLSVWHLGGLGVAAAVAEGLAPRGSDNAVVPAVVWAVALVAV